jgi:hypothetical protein
MDLGAGIGPSDSHEDVLGFVLGHERSPFGLLVFYCGLRIP